MTGTCTSQYTNKDLLSSFQKTDIYAGDEMGGKIPTAYQSAVRGEILNNLTYMSKRALASSEICHSTLNQHPRLR